MPKPKIITLDEDVINSLRFLEGTPLPKFDLDRYQLPLVVGSGNAINTGKIIFSGKAAIFSDESSFKQALNAYKPIIDGGYISQAVIISASGEKDSVWEIQAAKESGLKTTLLTCEDSSSAAQIADEVRLYRKISEPYTYNFSTYVGMVLSATWEPIDKILQLLIGIKLPERFDAYQSYSFILPDEHLNIAPMLEIKRNELFGPHLCLRAFTFGHARHAGFVHPAESELVINVGGNNDYFGHPQHRLSIELPQFAKAATYMSLCYYLIGKIQSAKTPYFINNIEAYCRDYGPKAYGKKQVFDIIVPGN